MSEVKDGKFVQVHYVGSLDDGTVFDDSRGREPFEFQIGAQRVIAGFEAAVRTMKLNEEKTVTLTPAEAYGERQEGLIREFPIAILGQDRIETGQEVWFDSPHGPIPGRVLAMGPDSFTVDFNHPLAGKNLHFTIKLVGISDTPTQTLGCSCSADPSDCGSGCSC